MILLRYIVGDAKSLNCTEDKECELLNLTTEKCNNVSFNKIDYRRKCPVSCNSCNPEKSM